MTKRKPMCMIKGCNHRAKRKVRIDIGPTVGDAVVAPEARIQTIGVCQGHFDLVTVDLYKDGSIYSLGDVSISEVPKT